MFCQGAWPNWYDAAHDICKWVRSKAKGWAYDWSSLMVCFSFEGRNPWMIMNLSYIIKLTLIMYVIIWYDPNLSKLNLSTITTCQFWVGNSDCALPKVQEKKAAVAPPFNLKADGTPRQRCGKLSANWRVKVNGEDALFPPGIDIDIDRGFLPMKTSQLVHENKQNPNTGLSILPVNGACISVKASMILPQRNTGGRKTAHSWWIWVNGNVIQ